jgi:hypothetical protein
MSDFADSSALVRKQKEIITPLKAMKDKKRKRRSYVASSGSLKGRGLVERLKKLGY